jgi:threonine aldolase
MKGLASDNQAGVIPEVMAAIVACNVDHAMPYGQDEHTAQAIAAIKREFGEQVEAFFVFNGTAANVLAIGTLIQRHEAVICADTAHLNIDECGAPERYLGSKLLLVPNSAGKITPEGILNHIVRRGDQHCAQASVVSLAQPTEYGTVYSLDELRAIVDTAKEHGLYVHIDGARIGNAAASLGVSLKAMCVGIDALSFGGAKAGLMLGEAVLIFRPEHAKNFRYARKQAMQLGSKGRFLGAQFFAYLPVWKKYAEHCNAMAQRLAASVRDIPGVTITQPVQANAVFARIPKEAIKPLMKHTHFYVWNELTHEVRWMTSWDTSAQEIDAFANRLRELLA